MPLHDFFQQVKSNEMSWKVCCTNSRAKEEHILQNFKISKEMRFKQTDYLKRYDFPKSTSRPTSEERPEQQPAVIQARRASMPQSREGSPILVANFLNDSKELMRSKIESRETDVDVQP